MKNFTNKNHPFANSSSSSSSFYHCLLPLAMALNLWNLLSESKRIIKTHPRHFLYLSLIFLLPLSSLSLIFQQLVKHFQQQQTINPSMLYFSLLYYLFFLFLSFSAVSTITYSIFHVFHGKPIKLQETIKSISTSFFPLLATTIIYQVILFFILFLCGLLLGLIILVAALFIDITASPYFLVLYATLVMLILLPVVIYLQVNWALVPVIVVIESCWGLEPLRRSASLVKGMKRVVVSSFFFFGILNGILTWGYSSLTTVFASWVMIWGISPILAMLLLCNFVVNTVLYIYCKDNHDQLAEEFEKEKDNVSLPLIP